MIEKIFIKQGIKKVQLHQYLRQELERAGFTGFEMVKTPLVTRIVVNVSRPGLAIGKGGQNIRTLTETIARNYQVENPQLEIREITNPELDAKSMADKMKASVERGFSWRSVAFRAVNDIDRAGAMGLEVILSGKLAGKGGRKKKVRFVKGYMKKVGDQTNLVDTAKITSYPKVGAIGITVRIIRPGTFFPDKMDVRAILRERKEALEGAKPATAPAPKVEVAVEAEAPVEAKAEPKPKKARAPKEKKAKEVAEVKPAMMEEAPKEESA